jgi:GINS complex subunit 1
MEEIYTTLKNIHDEYRDYDGNYPNNVKVTVAYFLHCQTRNQRYLQSYLLHRSEKLRKLRWETGVVMPENIQREKVSIRETEYFSEYNKIAGEYFDSIGFDLTSDMSPPKDLLIQVRVKKASGEILTDNGPIVLDVGSTQFLRRSDVEHLIRQGIVEHVRDDDS